MSHLRLNAAASLNSSPVYGSVHLPPPTDTYDDWALDASRVSLYLTVTFPTTLFALEKGEYSSLMVRNLTLEVIGVLKASILSDRG